ncbi:hypothetical protein FGB62_61g166 [Gracilaria domingensis]|nr:hypothetical protein FGB62_61g166 [Gracilaria domingensis]
MGFPSLHLARVGALLEVFVAATLLHVLGTNVETLHQNVISNLLGDLDAHSSARHIEDTAGSSLVELVRHALHDGGVDVNVDKVADLEGLQVTRVGALSVGTNHGAVGDEAGSGATEIGAAWAMRLPDSARRRYATRARRCARLIAPPIDGDAAALHEARITANFPSRTICGTRM